MSTSPSDATVSEALAAWRAGRPDGFAAIYSRYFPRVREIVRVRMGARLRSSQESLDVVQDVFVRLFDSPPPEEIAGDETLCAYLASTVESRLCDLARHQNRAKRDVHRELRGEEACAQLDLVAVQASTPSELLMGKELYQRYLDVVASLPEREREAVVLARHMGLSSEEGARRLGLASAGSFRMLLARALAKVALALREPA